MCYLRGTFAVVKLNFFFLFAAICMHLRAFAGFCGWYKARRSPSLERSTQLIKPISQPRRRSKNNPRPLGLAGRRNLSVESGLNVASETAPYLKSACRTSPHKWDEFVFRLRRVLLFFRRSSASLLIGWAVFCACYALGSCVVLGYTARILGCPFLYVYIYVYACVSYSASIEAGNRLHLTFMLACMFTSYQRQINANIRLISSIK